MRVEVYWNLHKHQYSIRSKGRVIMHADKVMLRDAKFVVQPAGRERVLATGQKSIHAFVRGELEGAMGYPTQWWRDAHIWLPWAMSESWEKSDREYERFALREGDQVYYNPMETETFVTGDEPIFEAPMALLKKKPRVYAFDPLEMAA